MTARSLSLVGGFVDRPLWMRDAACIEHPPDMFFPTRGQSAGPALAICAACRVRPECREWAIAEFDQGGDLFGICGGLTGMQRRLIRAERRRTTGDAHDR